MAKTIGRYAVHVHDEAGELHSFLPGQKVPAWAEKLLGDHCFKGYVFEGDEPLPDEDDDTSDDAADDDGDDGDDLAVPTKRAGLPKWAAYAKANGVDPDGLDKAEVIAALEEAGVPVE